MSILACVGRVFQSGLVVLICFLVMTTNSLICVTCVHHTLILCYIVVFHVFSSFDHQISFYIEF